MKMAVVKIFTLFLIIFGAQYVVARPNNRIKRVSDSHLADLETRIALNKAKGMAITVPVGAGLVDPKYIGRRRRSQSHLLDVLLNQSEEDNGDPIFDYDDLIYNAYNSRYP